ncbi:type VI secretion system protein TssA [Cupriavidus plantarum]|uniref:Type VI secretion system protein ImpA n=1 Tax=Cupriavidus plantarum TaxID=942865 RepID=A0A316ENP8_9BURK|nr:type VI secretion system protein TssA [Cupriavidus plantarum]NYI01978.1 type VI secretion system protein ImpA [Cupriavidus plantarum]PWK34111.1 type VI secretion system protein ImpA [Cupriavidus plantarum]REE91284.1 type VI secretion system protein ImpA [Cupriavidus plantarum]RLK31638.1 type VI secretion system protein ImpA [Cupriavidus plantarum]
MANVSVDQLLTPIPGDLPCGDDMLFSAEFDRIQEARRFDDPSLDQGEWVTDLKEADWREVVKIGTALLGGQTKDLRVAVWMTEALSKTNGFGGLRDGYLLTAGLCERFWDGMHPQADAEDIEYRTGSAAWLASRSRQLIREVPLVDEARGGYSFIDWEAGAHLAEALRRDPDNAEALAAGKTTLEAFEAARKATPAAFHATLLADIGGCREALQRLAAVLDLQAGEHAPSFRPALEALDAVQALVERWVEKPVTNAVTPDEEKGAAKPGAPVRQEPTFVEAMPLHGVPGSAASGPLRSRQQALAQLRDVAEFFRRTEPHSPVAYLAARAARWGDMPLHEWLRTVVKDDATLAQLEELLGMNQDPAAE